MSGSFVQHEEKLFFISPEGSLNECVFIGRVFMNHMVLQVHVFTHFVESTLEFQPVIGLDEYRLEG